MFLESSENNTKALEILSIMWIRNKVLLGLKKTPDTFLEAMPTKSDTARQQYVSKYDDNIIFFRKTFREWVQNIKKRLLFSQLIKSTSKLK